MRLWIGVQNDFRPVGSDWNMYLETLPEYEEMIVSGAFGWQPGYREGVRRLLINAHLINTFPPIGPLMYAERVRFFIGAPDYKVRLQSLPGIFAGLNRLGVRRIVLEGMLRWTGAHQVAWEIATDMGIDAWVEGIPQEGDEIPAGVTLVMRDQRLANWISDDSKPKQDRENIQFGLCPNPKVTFIRKDWRDSMGVFRGAFGREITDELDLITVFESRGIKTFLFPEVAKRVIELRGETI